VITADCLRSATGIWNFPCQRNTPKTERTYDNKSGDSCIKWHKNTVFFLLHFDNIINSNPIKNLFKLLKQKIRGKEKIKKKLHKTVSVCGHITCNDQSKWGITFQPAALTTHYEKKNCGSTWYIPEKRGKQNLIWLFFFLIQNHYNLNSKVYRFESVKSWGAQQWQRGISDNYTKNAEG
jgi:hypothetical protein